MWRAHGGERASTARRQDRREQISDLGAKKKVACDYARVADVAVVEPADVGQGNDVAVLGHRHTRDLPAHRPPIKFIHSGMT